MTVKLNSTASSTGVRSNLVWHTCGKLQNLKLEGDASLKIVTPGWLETSLMIHFGFQVFNVNYFEEGHSEFRILSSLLVSAHDKQRFI